MLVGPLCLLGPMLVGPPGMCPLGICVKTALIKMCSSCDRFIIELMCVSIHESSYNVVLCSFVNRVV